MALYTLTYDRLEYTRRMFASLEGSTDIPFDHYVIDNGSRDGTREFLSERPGRVVRTVFNEENRGISQAWNQALELTCDRYDYLVKLDNDCEIRTRGWLEALLDVCEAADRSIVLSPYVRGLEGGPHPGGYTRIESTRIAGHPVGLTRHLGGICLLSPAELFHGFRFPAALPKHGNQDVHFSMHVRQRRNCRMGYVEDVAVENTDGVLQFAKYEDYFATRVSERRMVYGEHPVVTTLAWPVRRARLIRAMHAAGLSDRTVLAAIRDKLTRTIAPKRPVPNDDDVDGGREWTS